MKYSFPRKLFSTTKVLISLLLGHSSDTFCFLLMFVTFAKPNLSHIREKKSFADFQLSIKSFALLAWGRLRGKFHVALNTENQNIWTEGSPFSKDR